MILKFHGKLKEMYGDSAEIATDVPAEALEGFFSQQPNHPRDMMVAVADFDTEDKLRAKTEVTILDVLPTMFGGGGRFGSIILGALVFAVGAIIFFTPGGQALGLSLMISGGLMALQGVIALFMKAPTADKTDDPPASKYLGQNKNTVEQGTAITIACGQINLAGHWLSLQSDADKLMHGIFPANPT